MKKRATHRGGQRWRRNTQSSIVVMNVVAKEDARHTQTFTHDDDDEDGGDDDGGKDDPKDERVWNIQCQHTITSSSFCKLHNLKEKKKLTICNYFTGPFCVAGLFTFVFARALPVYTVNPADLNTHIYVCMIGTQDVCDRNRFLNVSWRYCECHLFKVSHQIPQIARELTINLITAVFIHSRQS